MSEINVIVIEYARKKNLYMRYTEPTSKKRIERTTGTSNRRAAEKAAAKWESELEDGRYKAPSKITWAEFRQRYEDGVLAPQSDASFKKANVVFDAVEQHVNPRLLAALDAQQISKLCQKLRDQNRKPKPCAESTIKGYLAYLKAALNWAKDQKLLREVPEIKSPPRAKKSAKAMKGRPIATEEFERVLAKVDSVIGLHRKNLGETRSEYLRQASESWKCFLRGLWVSGLRLGESLVLSWDGTAEMRVDLSQRRPMLWIPANEEKGNEDRRLPIAPEFAEFLLATPEDERNGFVFTPLARRPWQTKGRLRTDTISDIGEAANVVVNTDRKTGKVSYASAHDFRRSFGERWALRVMPAVLMELMRHDSIDTTMKFYVGRNAQRTAEEVWEAYAKVSGGGRPGGNAQFPAEAKNAKTP